MKAIEILKKFQDEIQTVIPNDIDLYEAIDELQDLKSRSCENCYESKTCKILHSVYKDRLKKEGYAMHKNEFKCGFWHSLFWKIKRIKNVWSIRWSVYTKKRYKI